ncbi:hypothetical protein jhhlp_000333 [Lomentospora prolificans]|uniref:Carboxypeptidase n=1 Tax=Lomentospora prolificans TaxID=41688 RepID=A0A2N3NKV2_9PEZI|nr:hypothetical protein jhhlp_000333 [Lomentospora prolificans]
MQPDIFRTLLGACIIAAGLTSASVIDRRYIQHRDALDHNVFEHGATGAKLSFVKNSGICETTAGVNQYSGYLSVGENLNMWFWFFEARENPETAPLISWLGGGPGNAAEYGLFTQNGPCQFYDEDTEPSLNPHSFNNYANVLYIDQPIGTGFSYGDTSQVNSTKDSSPYVWNLLQAFSAAFPEYEGRDFGIFTESYGGHTGPEVARYILEKNEEIEKGADGTKINLVALGLSNAWFDARMQELANIEYAFNNPYRPLINETVRDELLSLYNETVVPSIDKCRATDSMEDCFGAYMTYLNDLEFRMLAAARETYGTVDIGDIRANPTRPNTQHIQYLQRPDIQEAVGGLTNYTDSGGAIGIVLSGDGKYPYAKSFTSELSDVVKAGVKVLIWTGDADYVCNYVGTQRIAESVEWSGQQVFTDAAMEPYTVNGIQKGEFKKLDNLNLARVYEAGHNLMWYQPEAGIQIFRQFLIEPEGVRST